MQIDNRPSSSLFEEIKIAFPQKKMPQTEELTVHQDGCSQCNCLREDLETVRGQPITGAVIRLVYQDLACFSTKSLLWILPHYLQYCLSPEGEQSRTETEFFVYSFSPTIEFRGEALERFAFLTKNQIVCLIHFLDWCSAHPHWGGYFPDDLQNAKGFLGILLGAPANGKPGIPRPDHE